MVPQSPERKSRIMNKSYMAQAKVFGKYIVYINISDLTAFVQADANADIAAENEDHEAIWCRKSDLSEIEIYPLPED